MTKIETILKRLHCPFGKYTRVTEESFASEVFLIESEGEHKILKCAHNEIKYWRELKTLEFLKDHILVPNVLDSLDPEPGFNGALLMNRLPGHPLNFEKLNFSLVTDCGRLLAKLHSVPTPGLGYFQKNGFEKVPFENWWSYRRDIIFGAWTTAIEHRVDVDILKRVHTIFSQYFDSFNESPECYIHCDYRLGNILSDHEKITGLIDFESSRTGDPAYDFIKIYESIGSQKNLWENFLSGYAEFRPLPNLKETIPYYELDLNFGFLQWAVLREEEKLFNERLATLISLLDKNKEIWRTGFLPLF